MVNFHRLWPFISYWTAWYQLETKVINLARTYFSVHVFDNRERNKWSYVGVFVLGSNKSLNHRHVHNEVYYVSRFTPILKAIYCLNSASTKFALTTCRLQRDLQRIFQRILKAQIISNRLFRWGFRIVIWGSCQGKSCGGS